MFAAVALGLYFVLNLLLTLSNRALIQQVQTPSYYLLTVSHATATFLPTWVVISSATKTTTTTPLRHLHHPRRQPPLWTLLALFSLLFTVNISLSNYSLGLVSSLPVHQTIRAIAPFLTVVLSILLGLKTWSSYRGQTYLALGLIVAGVVLATFPSTSTSALSTTTSTEVLITLLGAVTAVLKTIATHALQTDLGGIPSTQLIHMTAPLAIVQGLLAAWWHGELNFDSSFSFLPWSEPSSVPSSVHWHWLVNSLLAAALNLASFEANKRCGPLTMGVAANLKQIVILFLPFASAQSQNTKSWAVAENVIVGSLATVLGGIWYAYTVYHTS